MRYESFVTQESFNPATNFTELRKRLQKFHESTTQRHKGQSGSVALGVKHDFKKGPKKGNCFVCGISGHFAKDCRRKETAQCSKCGEKDHLDRACRRQWDEGKHESVAMGSTLASPDEEYWAALTPWKTAGMLVDIGCTDHIVTNIDAFLDIGPIQSVVRNPNAEASRVVGRGCVRISIPSNKGEFQCELKNVLCVPDYSSNLLSVSRCTEWWHSFAFKKKIDAWNSKSKTNTRELFVLLTLQRSRNQDEFQQRETWQFKEVAQMIGSFESSECGQRCTRDSGGTRWCIKSVRIGQDHKDSSTKNGRDPSRGEAVEGVHRRDWSFQSRVVVSVPVLHCVCRPVHEVRVCGLA